MFLFELFHLRGRVRWGQLNLLHYSLFLLHWFRFQLFQGGVSLRCFFPINGGLQILQFSSHYSFFQRFDPYVASSVIMDRLISDSIDSEQISELLYALAAIRIVCGTCALGDSWGPCQEISSFGYDVNRLQLRIEVLDEPVKPNVVTVILLSNNFAHFFEELNWCVIEIHEVPTDECHSNQSQREHFFFLPCTIFKTMILRVLEVSNCIGDDGPDSANCIFLPYLESSFQFLTIDHYIIVDVKVDCLLALLGDLVTPVH